LPPSPDSPSPPSDTPKPALWQSRQFWEQADKALTAHGELLGLYEANHAGAPSPGDTATSPAEPASPPALATIMLVWSDGTVTTVRPPPPCPPPQAHALMPPHADSTGQEPHP